MTRPRWGHLLALGAALALGGLASVGPADVAGGSAAGACTTAGGITVVVDFGSTGGGVQVGCAAPPVANGFAALSRAGFPIRNVSSQPGFLCQIDGKPADYPCTHVPSSARYWSYWYAARGGDWTYSSSGASRTPPPGSVEGWAFGAGDPPRTPPPAPLATTTTTTTRATSTPVPSTVTTVPPATAGGVTSSTMGDDESTAVIVDGERTTTSTVTDRDSGAGVAGDGEQAADFVTTAARDDDVSGSPAGTVVGIAAVLGLAGAGAVTTRHRRRSHADGGE